MSVQLSPQQRLSQDLADLCARLGLNAGVKRLTAHSWRWWIAGGPDGCAPSIEAAQADLRAALKARAR